MSQNITIKTPIAAYDDAKIFACRKAARGVEWAPKDIHGRIVITSPGRWRLVAIGGGQVRKATIVVSDDGTWLVSGLGRRWFDVVK